MSCFCAGSASKKYQPREPETESVQMEFKHVPEPQQSELVNYLRSRREHVHIYMNTADIKAEITRNVTETIQPVDQYPKGRQFLHDEDYLSVVRDMLNLSNILDDMEQTGWVPYTSRTQYYNMYSKLYRSLLQRASSNPR